MTKVYGFRPTLITYTNLICLCAAVSDFDKADNFWKLLLDQTELTIDLNAYNVMIKCYLKSHRLDQAFALFKQLRNSNLSAQRSLKPDGVTYSSLITAFAKYNKSNVAEKLFCLALKDLNDLGTQRMITVYQPLMDAYSRVGDVYNALMLLNVLLTAHTNGTHDVCAMMCTDGDLILMDGDSMVLRNIAKHNKQQRFPKLNVQCFNVVLKAFIRMKKEKLDKHVFDDDKQKQLLLYLSHSAHSWSIIDYLLRAMNDMNIGWNLVTYAALFHLCNFDVCFQAVTDEQRENAMMKAMEIYQDMRNDSHIQIRSDLEMSGLLLTALSAYRNDKSKKLQFVQWWLAQVKQLNVSKSDFAMQEILKSGLSLQELDLT